MKSGNKVTLDKTNYYDDWFNGLTDEKAKDRIDGRIFNAEGGNFGECRSVGGGVFEMVIHYGPGYRLYYCQRGKDEYLLLIGGTNTKLRSKNATWFSTGELTALAPTAPIPLVFPGPLSATGEVNSPFAYSSISAIWCLHNPP